MGKGICRDFCPCIGRDVVTSNVMHKGADNDLIDAIMKGQDCE